MAPEAVSSSGPEAIEIAELARLHLDPWQKLVLHDALGESAEGRWAAWRVGLEVPRQNGKGAVLEARELAGLFAFGERLIIHSAHEQATATEHFHRLLALMEGVPEFDRRIQKVSRGKGQEAIILRDGARIFFKTRTGGGGRGFTADLVVLDEAMILAPSFMGALVPTMAARAIDGNPQLWFAGSAVDQQNPKMDGIEFARLRKDALDGAPRLAYFGWSAPFARPDDVPVDALGDPEMWALANPSLGIRISPGHVSDERSALGFREFCVERLGVGDWPSTEQLDGRLFQPGVWEALADLGSSPEGPVCFACDIAPDRSRAAIGVAGVRSDGRRHVEIVDERPGTDWLAERIAALTAAHSHIGVVIVNGRSQAASVVPDLQRLGVQVQETTAAEMAAACGRFHDAVVYGSLRHLGTEDLAAALEGAARRPLGDAWAWDHRTSTGNIAPLVAVTLALWGLETRPQQGAPRLINLAEV